MAVLGACALTGTSGGSLDSAENTAQQTRAMASQSRAMASQSIDECLPRDTFWDDRACLLEHSAEWRLAGPGDRGGQDGGDTGDTGDTHGDNPNAGRGDGSEGTPDDDPGNSGDNNQGGD